MSTAFRQAPRVLGRAEETGAAERATTASSSGTPPAVRDWRCSNMSSSFCERSAALFASDSWRSSFSLSACFSFSCLSSFSSRCSILRVHTKEKNMNMFKFDVHRSHCELNAILKQYFLRCSQLATLSSRGSRPLSEAAGEARAPGEWRKRFTSSSRMRFFLRSSSSSDRKAASGS